MSQDSGSSKSSGFTRPSGSKPRLLLRFTLPGGISDEVYVARKLTFGRTADNVFVIDDPSVDRHHAVVDVLEGSDGPQFVIRCLEPQSFLLVNGEKQSEVVLKPGLCFSIGPGHFECVAIGEEKSQQPAQDWSCCPLCGQRELPPAGSRAIKCPQCRGLIAVVTDALGQKVGLPARVGQFELRALLGQGAMGWVFEARVGGKDACAIKILMPHVLQEDKSLQRFRREIQTMQSVKHPRVMRMRGYGQWKGLRCLVLPLMRRGNLREVIRQNRAGGKLCDFETAKKWFLEVLEGLEAIHRAGLVHRDIKPSNILLDERGGAVVADLGVVRRIGQETASLTVTGAAMGTYHYMAPEQWENPEGVDARADFYALGVTFYELLTGVLPTGRWRSPSTINPTVPESFDGIIERLLDPNPETRFASEEAIREELIKARLLPPPVPSVCVASTPDTRSPARPDLSHSPGTLFARVGGASWRHWFAEHRWLKAFAAISLLMVLVVLLIWVLVSRPPNSELISGPSDFASLSDPASVFVSFGSGHENSITSVAFSPNGRDVLTGSLDKTARLWDVATGKELRRFEGHTAAVNSVAFSPNGRQVLTGAGRIFGDSSDNTARLWDVTTGNELRRFEGHTNAVWSVTFSPDGRQVLTGSHDKTARLWDVTTGNELRRFEGHTAAVNAVAFSPDGRQVLTGSGDNTARLWDVTTGNELGRFYVRGGSAQAVLSVAFSPDGRWVTLGGSHGRCCVWQR